MSLADVAEQHEHATQHPRHAETHILSGLSTRLASFSDDERLAGSRAVELRPQAPTVRREKGHKKNNEKKAREGALCIR